ncbi:hypothetical protein [Acetobacterium sp.]|uniref:hypothetical protein n=1 Tax=Acetobacterium sp. TaxID=1872094 RepID=UPI002725224C|nr:hypothetical protein [Acetobacterium sp.]MDO9492841.1 hypothetical protein [Acetobacterium sp.]
MKQKDCQQLVADLNISDIKKETLAGYGIYTVAQLMEEFHKPFYTRAFTTPVSRNLTAMKEQEKRNKSA